MNTHEHNDGCTYQRKRRHGIGTVIACFAAAILIVALLDDDGPTRVNAALSAPLLEAATETTSDTADGRMTFKINKGHVEIVPTTGAMKIEMDEELRVRTQIKTDGARTTITVDDDYNDEKKIKILVPASAACRVELSAGLLEVKGLPCADSEMVVRSGKLEVENVPKVHGKLAGSVSVGTVKIDGGNGQQSKSSGVGDLRAEIPGTGSGPALTARVDVGMLTVDVE